MEKLKFKRKIESQVDGFYEVDVDLVINELNRLKVAGCTIVTFDAPDYSDVNLYGEFDDEETDEEFEKRIAEQNAKKLRKEQAELVELARLKEKYEKKS